MMVSRSGVALIALTLLAACEARIGRNETATEPAAAAEARAEEGTFSIDAPGFAMKLDIPESIANGAEIDSDSGILYPGSKLSGLHVQASEEGAQGKGGVELRFTSADAVDRIAGWYRDPARAAEFAIVSAARDGEALVLSGTEKEDGDPFTLRLSPRPGGGSEGRLTLSDRS